MRFQALDGWRGVCALLVALFHLQAASHFRDSALVQNAFLFVDFFFVLSGFVLMHACERKLNAMPDFIDFAVKRLVRLYPLHLFVLAIFFGLELVKVVALSAGFSANHDSFDGSRSLSSLLSNVLLLHSIGLHDQLTWNTPSWSIGAEFYVNLIFGLLLLTVGATRWRRSVFFYLFVALGSALLLARVSAGGIEATFDFGLLRCMYGFMCGVATYRIYRQAGDLEPIRATLAEVTVLSLVIAFVLIGDRPELSYGAPLVFSAAVFIFAREEGLISSWMCRAPFQMLGRISYSIYMVHMLIAMNLFDRLVLSLEKLFRTSLTMPMDDATMKMIVLGGKYQCDVLALAYMAITILAAAWTYAKIEVPGRAYFERLLHHATDNRSARIRTS